MDELNLGLLCFIAYRSMETQVVVALAEAGHADFTVAQGRVFAQIAAEGSRVTELAERARVTKQTAGFLVDGLEKAGYVRRVPDPADARARLVTITARGHRAVAVARRAEAAVEQAWAARLGPAATKQLRAALTELRELTDPYR